MTTDEEIVLVAKIAAIIFKKDEDEDEAEIVVRIARQILATAARLQFEEGTVLL